MNWHIRGFFFFDVTKRLFLGVHAICQLHYLKHFWDHPLIQRTHLMFTVQGLGLDLGLPSTYLWPQIWQEERFEIRSSKSSRDNVPLRMWNHVWMLYCYFLSEKSILNSNLNFRVWLTTWVSLEITCQFLFLYIIILCKIKGK